MKIEALHVGMSVRHPQYGLGTVKSISESTADILFTDGKRTVEPSAAGLEPAEPHVAVQRAGTCPSNSSSNRPWAPPSPKLGLQPPDSVVAAARPALARRQGGDVPNRPDLADQRSAPRSFLPQDRDGPVPTSASSNRRSNAHEKLSDGGKVEMQQYITESYGSLTTFNVLFKDKEDQF